MTDAPDTTIPEGWTLVHESPDTVVLERIVAGKAVNATGRELDHAIEDALAFDQRLADFPEHVRSSHGNPACGPAEGGSTEPKADQQDPTAPKRIGASDLKADRFEREPESDIASRSDLSAGRLAHEE